MKQVYTYFWKTLPVGDLISLALISLTFSKSSQIGPSSSNHLKMVVQDTLLAARKVQDVIGCSFVPATFSRFQFWSPGFIFRSLLVKPETKFRFFFLGGGVGIIFVFEFVLTLHKNRESFEQIRMESLVGFLFTHPAFFSFLLSN